MRSELCAFGTSSLVRVGVQSSDRQTGGSGDSFMREEGLYWYTGVTSLVKVILDSVSWARKWIRERKDLCSECLAAADLGRAGSQRAV